MCTAAYLEIAQLSELLAAVVESAGEGLDLLVYDLVGANVASLCKSLPTDVTAVGPLSCVTPLVCLLAC